MKSPVMNPTDTFLHNNEVDAKVAETVYKMVDAALTARDWPVTPENRRAVLKASARTFATQLDAMRAVMIPDLGEDLAQIIGGTIFGANGGPTAKNITRANEVFGRFLQGREIVPQTPSASGSPETEEEEEEDDDLDD